MSGFAVDFELLAELVERMTICGQTLTTVQQDVDARVSRVHATWRGMAAAEQADAHRRWLAGSAQMHEALGVLRSIACTAHGNYSSAVRANAQMWSQ
ncbi:MAG: WXG100 family type VII secretion target [Jatrophihabitans sp.]